MSITMAQLASRFAKASGKVTPATQDQLRGLAAVGEGMLKQEIQAVHAVDTGAMLNSVTSQFTSPSEVLIGPTVDYAPFVALGTSRMAARPFHITAARRLQGAINQGNILRDLGIL